MKILQKIFIPIVIFTLLFSNVGFNIVKHTCGSTGSVNISLYFEEVCSDDSCLETDAKTDVEKVSSINSTQTENHCCDGEVAEDIVENNTTITHNTSVNEITCCSNEVQDLGKIIEFTITTYPEINFESNVVIAERFNYNVTLLNQNYELLIENINNKIKDFGKNILKFLIQQFQSSNSDSEDNTI